MGPSTQLDQTFSALADPTRRALLERLRHSDASVSDLAKPFLKDMSLPAITKHLKVLEKAGLITKSRDAQWRHCKLNAEALRDAAAWMEQYRVFWEESFDRLEVYLKSVTARPNIGKPHVPKKKAKRHPTH
jgi:DNA-binding transcriptional ArsR family regulator